ncbi:MAG: hypothetical protein ACXAEX_22680 [Promethearchaeota archaeon]
MEKRSIISIVSAGFLLILFVGIPYMVKTSMLAQFGPIFSKAGLDINGLIYQIMIFGIIIASLTLIKGFISETSILALIISIAQKTFMIIITVILLGVGSLSSVGITKMDMEIENSFHTITMDFRPFLYFTLLLVSLKVVLSYLEWIEIRKKNDAQLYTIV